jgi:hypothetical protein
MDPQQHVRVVNILTSFSRRFGFKSQREGRHPDWGPPCFCHPPPLSNAVTTPVNNVTAASSHVLPSSLLILRYNKKINAFVLLFMSIRWDCVSELRLPTVMFIPKVIGVYECRATAEWYWQGETEELREKSVPMTLFQPQISNELARVRTRAFEVRSWRLTAWAMSWPGTARSWRVGYCKGCVTQ